jgi:hypothetical protein
LTGLKVDLLLASAVSSCSWCFVDPENAGLTRAAEMLRRGVNTYDLTHVGGCGCVKVLSGLRMGRFAGLRLVVVAGVEEEDGGATSR